MPEGTNKGPHLPLATAKGNPLMFLHKSQHGDSTERYRRALTDALDALPIVAEREQSPDVTGPEPDRKPRQRIWGTVVSSKMDKTIVIRNERKTAHPKYKRVVRISKKFYAHDEFNSAQEGDWVRIVESRPLSKLKRWRLENILRRRSLQKSIPDWLRLPPLLKFSLPDASGKLRLDKPYNLRIHLQEDQYRLFDTAPEPAESAPSREISARNAKLLIKIGGASLKVSPQIAYIRNSGGAPLVDPPQVSVTPQKCGILTLTVSVLLLSTGELIQSQAFELQVD